MTSTPVIRYRKKPVIVEAMQWTGLNPGDLQAFTGNLVEIGQGTGTSLELRVWNTEESCWVRCPNGHSVIKGKLGEFYPISPQALSETYEVADE